MKIVNQRAEFSTIKKGLNQIGKGNARLTQSTLLLRQEIDNTKRVYEFPVLDTEGNPASNEIRLNVNDEFVATEIGIFLSGSITQGTAVSPLILTAAPLQLGTNSAQLNNLYSGKLKIAVNNVVYLEKWDLSRHYKVSRTQLQSSSAGIPAVTIDSNDFAQDGFYSLVPMITLSGAKKNEIQISITRPIDQASFTFTNQSGSNMTFAINGIVCALRGLLAQNASKFQGVGAPK